MNIDWDSVERAMQNELMRYHGCIIHNGPGSGPCKADQKRAAIMVKIAREAVEDAEDGE